MKTNSIDNHIPRCKISPSKPFITEKYFSEYSHESTHAIDIGKGGILSRFFVELITDPIFLRRPGHACAKTVRKCSEIEGVKGGRKEQRGGGAKAAKNKTNQ